MEWSDKTDIFADAGEVLRMTLVELVPGATKPACAESDARCRRL
jgi:hypothetical protein